MHLIYFDEAKNDEHYPHYHIGAVAVSEDHLSVVEKEVAAIAEKCFGSAELSAHTELHAAEIYHRKKSFKNWEDFDKRLGVLKEFLPILSKPEVMLIDIQINASLLLSNQVADEIAFMFLCERANDLMRAEKSVGLLIGDRENDKVAAGYAGSLSSYRATGTDFRFGRNIHNLVDSVHFTHSHLSRFLQLADVYTWFLQFMRRNRDSSNMRHKALLDCFREDLVNLFPSKYKEWPKK